MGAKRSAVRTLMYGLGGVALSAPLATALFIAFDDTLNAVREQARGVEHTLGAGEAAPRAPVRAPDFPAFAPEGVIIVPAPETRERIEVRRVAERTRPRARAAETASTAMAPVEAPAEPVVPRAPEPSAVSVEDTAVARRDEVASTSNVDAGRRQPARENYDNRSWYRSPNYWRELERRRRAR